MISPVGSPREAPGVHRYCSSVSGSNRREECRREGKKERLSGYKERGRLSSRVRSPTDLFSRRIGHSREKNGN